MAGFVFCLEFFFKNQSSYSSYIAPEVYSQLSLCMFIFKLRYTFPYTYVRSIDLRSHVNLKSHITFPALKALWLPVSKLFMFTIIINFPLILKLPQGLVPINLRGSLVRSCIVNCSASIRKIVVRLHSNPLDHQLVCPCNPGPWNSDKTRNLSWNEILFFLIKGERSSFSAETKILSSL